MSESKQVETSTLSASVVTKVVTALAASITAATNSAVSLLEFCKTAGKAGLGKTVAEPDVLRIVDELAATIGWNSIDPKIAKVRKSEARSLLRQHAYLPEAITAVRSATGSCGYHDAVKIARLIKEHGNVGDAVLALTTKKEAAKVDPAVRVANALKTWYVSVRDGRKTPKRTELMKNIMSFAMDNDLNIGQGE